MKLTFEDLDRLQKNGVGGFTTAEEQLALVELAREGLKAAQHHAHLTWLESHPCNCTGDDNFCHLPSCPRYIATQVA